MSDRCRNKPDGSVALPVLGEGGGPAMKKTRIGPWRAGVLIAVHVIMLIHIIQWLIMGSTLSPIEPSEAMQTLELGVINAGAIFFALAILATLVFGRYVCGWVCHIIALQDFCAWLMGRAGIRPKPFRARLLMLVPLILGTYMFIWPSFKRLALQPAFEALGLGWPWWLRRVEPLHGVQAELFVEEFWSTFPEWYIAVPFLLICGFATVYFLGSKAFCTYACPYGGLFALADPVAPFRVRVDHDKCRECGHCTAACTSNVRVHEEIKVYGMVVDPGCMKTMDCISVCPNDALSISPGRPGVRAPMRESARADAEKARARRQSRYDLTWPGEIAAAVVFFVLFIATRGMLDRVPMLMAGGLAAVGTGLSVVLWRMLTGPNARIHGLKLRFKGRLRPAGAVFALLMVAGWTVAVWGGVGNFTRWRAGALHAGIGIPVDALTRPEFAPSETAVRRAEAGIEWYARADSFGNGGLGWPLSPDSEVRLAYMHTVLGDYDAAVAHLRSVVERGNPTDSLVFQLLELNTIALREAVRRDRSTGERENAEQILRDALEKHPHLHGVRLRLAQLLHSAGRPDDSLWDIDDPEIADSPNFLLNRGQVLALAGDREGMSRILDRVLELEPQQPAVLFSAAQLANSIGRTADGQRLVERAVEAGKDASTLLTAARIAGSNNRLEDARALADRAARARGSSRPGVRFELGSLLAALGEVDRGSEMMLEAVDGLRHAPWQLVGIGSALTQMGLESDLPVLRDRGIEILEGLVRDHPSEPIFHHDLAGWLFSTGQADRAAEHIVTAAKLGVGNAILADRAAQLLEATGRREEAGRWRDESVARRRGD